MHKGKIAVLIEEHFDEHEYRRFLEYFPEKGYEVEFLSHLWGNPQLTFNGNDHTAQVTVSTEINDVRPEDYTAIILIGGYAMDRMRYQVTIEPGQPNLSPAVSFLRNAVAQMDTGRLKIGTICHSLWLFCADPKLLEGRNVTCAHNIICDVENAGGKLIYDGAQLADTVIDGNLISGRHPGVTEEFLAIFTNEIEK